MDQVRVNLRTAVVNSKIRREKRNGRDVIIVPSATLPDDIVMNKIRYPAAVIEAGYKTLDRTPAPLGHPMVNGQYISAFEPEAMNQYYVGAWNENVRRENGRVFLDKVIDVEVANRTEQGRKVLAAIEKQEPMSTSTGLLLNVTAEGATGEYDYIATSMIGDHDAILIGEAPAASTQQGVGIFVNAKGEEFPAHNAILDEDAMERIAESIAWQIKHAEEEAENKPLIDKIMKAIKSLLGGTSETTEGNALSVNTEEGSDMDLKELSDKLDQMAANMVTKDTVADMLKPVTDQVETLAANVKAQEDAQKSGLVEQVVKANLLDEGDAKALSVNALQKLASKITTPAPAAGVFGALAQNTENDDYSDELPGGEA